MLIHATQIICYDKLDTVASLSNIDALFSQSNFKFIHGDITDTQMMKHALSNNDIDCVMHFAASSHVQNSFNDGFTFTVNNVIGTQTILEAVRQHGKVKRFIHVSTDEVYGSAYGVEFDETAQLGPTNPYSASKAAAEMYVMAYEKSFKIPTVIVRSNNVYGPHQYPEKIIPVFTRLMMQGQKLTLQGDGSNTRRYLFGADAADAFDTILHKGELGEAYNVGSQDEVANYEVAQKLITAFGYDAAKDFDSHVTFIPDRPFNDLDYRVKDDKLRSLGWQQKVGFEEGLTKTIDWYRRFGEDWWTTLPGQKEDDTEKSLPQTPPPQYQTPPNERLESHKPVAIHLLAEKTRGLTVNTAAVDADAA